jgi:hypothetical protein
MILDEQKLHKLVIDRERERIRRLNKEGKYIQHDGTIKDMRTGKITPLTRNPVKPGKNRRG